MIVKTKVSNVLTGTVSIYRLENSDGSYIEVMDYGATLLRACVYDKNEKLTDVVLGYDNLNLYSNNPCYFGVTVGRNANRIENARFYVDNQVVELPKNENQNNVHSGPNGFEKKQWNVVAQSEIENSITFSYSSPDGENGYLGNFNVFVKYTFTSDHELKIEYDGVCDKDTIANLTNHSYFNLSGEGNGDILNHLLRIKAQNFTPVRSRESIPTGEYASVEGTPMDFQDFKEIGKDIKDEFEQLIFGNGYDHNFAVDDYSDKVMSKIATAYSPCSGIYMDVITDCPCVQLYSGNMINNEKGKNQHIYKKYAGFCLETQYEPNAINVAKFHSPLLRANEKYHSETVYKFYVN